MIRRYPDLAEEYSRIKQVQLSAPLSGMPRSKKVSDQTAAAALRTLSPVHQREYDAVHTALERTLQLPDGAERVRLVSMVFWQKSHTIDGAAQVLHISWMTAKRWHGEFIRLVAKYFGLL